LRGWVKAAPHQHRQQPGNTSSDAATIKALQAEVRELKRSKLQKYASSTG